MARRRKKKKRILSLFRMPSLPSLDLDSDTKKGIFIVFIMFLGAISLLGLFDLAGFLGLYLSQGLLLAFGWGKFILPIILLIWGYALYDEERFELRGGTYLGIMLFFIAIHTLFFLLVERDLWEESIAVGRGGGYLGLFFADIFLKLSGYIVSLLISLVLLIISLLLIFNTSLVAMFGRDSYFAKMVYPINFIIAKIFGLRAKEDDEESDEDEDENDDEEEDKDEDEEEENDEEEESDDEEKDEDDDDEEDDDNGDPSFAEDTAGKQEKEILASKNIPEKEVEDIWWMKPAQSNLSIPLSLLNSKRDKPTSGDIENNKEIIRKSLENFGIPVEMGAISVGPTVTQYTFRPAEGIKLSRITNLSNDLALALAVHPIRIEAPIPGKALVGVEVPNQAKAVVGFKEVMISKGYKNRKNNTQIALGKDVAGSVWLDDITRMPHLLVAGATNSGKSVCLNTVIVSLMYQNTPDNLRFIMVDPKRVELVGYNGMPYLMAPVITDVPKTINALKWCLNEMDRRFDILSKTGKRNIQTYNESMEIKMPYLVFVIDELADLMVAAAKDIEAGIIRLAQMARAVGIHLVLATQRPSVDVITGLIKANMPARIAFSVASSTDSRTILDSLGAEKLLGRGDMLFVNAELSKPVRIQGAFLSDDEIKKIVRYVKSKGGKPDFVGGITERQKVSGIGGVGLDGSSGDEDELLYEAREIVVNMGKASASLLQRKLRIGYARAASILDQLEELGVVGQGNGSKPREILISKQQLETLENQNISGVSVHNREETEAPENYLGEESEDPPVFKADENNNGEDEDVKNEDNEAENNDGENEPADTETSSSAEATADKMAGKDDDFDKLFAK